MAPVRFVRHLRGMSRVHQPPAALRGVPVTTREAMHHGIGRGSLAGPAWRQLFRGVFVTADTEIDVLMWLRAALQVLPPGTVVSHTSAMRVYGLHPRAGRHQRWEFSTNRSAPTRLTDVLLHRRGRRLHADLVEGLPTTGPERTFVDCALPLSFVELVQLGDHLVHTGRTTVDRLVEFAHTQHLHGVLRARRTVRFVRCGVESPLETTVRLMLVLARLPEPECNAVILDRFGDFLARGDLVYRRHKVLVEYDGWQHERDAGQRVKDIGRRERLEADGWRIIVVTVGDLSNPREIVRRVHTALAARDHTTPQPVMSTMWNTWFPTRDDQLL